MVLLLLTGCIFELFSQRTPYLSTEYTIEHPRIVGLSLQPSRIEPGQEYVTDAVLAATPEAKVQNWTLKTCGLGRPVPTSIGDLNCFNDPQEINVLASSNSLPLVWTPPEIPAIECPDYGWRDTGYGYKDTGYWGKDTGGVPDPPCSHSLPLVLEATVDEKPVLAAAVVNWFAEPSERSQPSSLRESRVVLNLPNSARAGDTIDVEIFVENDHRGSSFFWYVDGGELKRTGWTSAQSWLEDSPEWPTGRTGSNNEWVIPEKIESPLRILVTIVPCLEGGDCSGLGQAGGQMGATEYGLNMTWTQGAVVVVP